MRPRGSRFAIAISFSITIAGCSADRAPARAKPHESAPASNADSTDTFLGLTTPADGFQLRTRGADIGPGEEHEYCEVARIPGDASEEYYVSLVELANGPSSHHLGLAYAPPGSSAAAKAEALGVGNKVECPGPLLAFGDGIDIIGTIQIPHGEAALPPHVARKFTGGEIIVFDYHYANTGTEPIHAESAANFHVVDASEVEHIAQLFSLNNVTIDVPPGETASFTGECHFGADMMVGGLTRHTHHWGTDFSVWASGGANDGKELWTSHDWQHETQLTFPDAMLLHAGEGLRYRCTFANDTSRRLRFGTSVNDEMCMLYGPAWSVEADGGTLNLPDCNITWVDHGGIGHPANEAGGFPKPPAAEANLCIAAYGGASIDECSKCRCDACATPGIQCATDADCNALLTCYAACTDLDCAQSCQPTLAAHSAGAGLFTSVMECASNACPSCVPPDIAGAATF